ncbi:MAG: SET domain-containing protein-lysine N-methyltransferase [Acidobacteriota bacterium]|nr:SET domain-containing protein-lysine N-methyltransferase [Acidobacteriota bacterium]
MNLTYFSPKTEKRRSNIDGRGLFAREHIAKGEVVVMKGGYVLSRVQRDEVQLVVGEAEIQIMEDMFIGPITQEEREGGMIHLNHSCDPNVGVQGQIAFVAMRDIAADNELTVDYAMTDDEDYEMECNCRTPFCRKSITGRDWMKEVIQRKYDGYFSWFIQRRLNAQRMAGASQ